MRINPRLNLGVFDLCICGKPQTPKAKTKPELYHLGHLGACLQEGRKLVLSEEDTTYFCRHKTNSFCANLLASEWMLTAPLQIPDVCQPGNAAAVKGGEGKLRSLCFRCSGTELKVSKHQSNPELLFGPLFFLFSPESRSAWIGAVPTPILMGERGASLDACACTSARPGP